jgi:hypothetical protein
MKPFADDPDRNFECDPANAHASEAKAPGATDERSRETNASGNRADGARCHAPDAGDATADARGNAEKACEEEIEVTEEMIEAGAEAWALFERGDRLDWKLSEIYTAMQKARIYGHSGSARCRQTPLEVIYAYLSRHMPQALRNDK